MRVCDFFLEDTEGKLSLIGGGLAVVSIPLICLIPYLHVVGVVCGCVGALLLGMAMVLMYPDPEAGRL